MEERNIYHDISERTNGDIYIGVVGPVRTGKSTFIKKFMDTIVIPNIEGELTSGTGPSTRCHSLRAGRTIMTTEPKFIPEQAVTVKIDALRSVQRPDDRLCGLYCPQCARLCGKRSAAAW